MPNASSLKEFGRLKTSAASKLIPAPPRLSDIPKLKKMFPEIEKFDEDLKKFAQEGIGKTVNET